jgi:Spy/CpxP family protein refolding chaperone
VVEANALGAANKILLGKTMNKFGVAFVLAVGILAAPCAAGQDRIGDVTDMQALRAAVKTDKRTFVASALNLTPAEAKKFWPIYDTYQRAVDASNRERTVAIEGLVGYDKPLSDPYAKNLAKELVTADEAEVKARRTMYNKVMKTLPPQKAARYLQLESKIRAAQAYDIAVAIPLVK